MKYWRPILILLLVLIPILTLAAFGGWLLWERGWFFWLWWLLPVFWGLAIYLSRRWQDELLPRPGIKPPTYWTPRDREAARLVEARQRAVKQHSAEQLAEPQFYLQTAEQLALEIARVYHPGAQHAVSRVTVPEILAVLHLASEDLEGWVERYVPASHLVTIDNWQTLSHSPRWFTAAGNLSWAVSLMLNPANLARYLTSQFAFGSLGAHVQENMLAAFYITFVRQVGFYIIEMNSGRLRGGASRYRRGLGQLIPPPAGNAEEATRQQDGEVPPNDALRSNEQPAQPVADSADVQEEVPPLEVTLALVGQVKAGKSSLANALIGTQQAAVDVLPTTRAVERYRVEFSGRGDQLVLLDTPGYGEVGATDEELRQTRLACEQADLVLLVMDARSSSRQVDLELVEQLAEWFADRPEQKPPTLLGVLTHVDGLRPVMEWSPPYDYQTPKSAKERSIHDALAYNRELFGPLLTAAVPACTDVARGRVFGINEWVLPVLVALLDEARGCALVRMLHKDAQAGRYRRVFRQLYQAGGVLLRAYLLGEAATAARDPAEPPPSK